MVKQTCQRRVKEKGFATPAIDRLRFANPLYGLIPLPSYRKKHIRCINSYQLYLQRKSEGESDALKN
jgi:hypothetical protein